MSHEPMRVKVTSADITDAWADLHQATKSARKMAQLALRQAEEAERAVDLRFQELLRVAQEDAVQLELDLQSDDVGN